MINFIKLNNLVFISACLLGAVLFLSPIYSSLSFSVGVTLAVTLITISLWSTGVVAPALGAVIFFFAATIFSLGPPSIIFSGFQAPATWLVFGGLVISLCLKNTKLDITIVGYLLRFTSFKYFPICYGIFLASFFISFFVPSASARVALLVPIIIMFGEKIGFKPKSLGNNGLVLSATMGTMTPAFGILPSNVPNVALLGASESIKNITFSYGEYFLLNFPVLGIGALIFYPMVIGFIFAQEPEKQFTEIYKDKMEAKQKRLLFILILALLFWTTDGYHQISPAWVALGASVLCLLPKLGVLSGKALANLDFSQVIFVAGIIGLGGIASYSGAGAYIAEIIIRIMPMDKVGNFATFYLVVCLSWIIGVLTTLPAQPSILVPIASDISVACGWSIKSVLMTPVISWSIFPFFYQAPPLVLAVALGQLRVVWVTRMLFYYMIIGLLVLLPLHYLWGTSLGYFL